MSLAVQDVRAEKVALREAQRQRRAALAVADVRAASAAVCALVARLPAFARAHRLALYAAMPHEGELDALPLAASREACFPRIASRRPPRLAFHRLDPSQLAPDAWGIPTPPADSPEVPLATCDLVLVPGLAFARDGQRLGFGRGYYDAALAAAPSVLRVGLCHSFQLVGQLPHTDADQPVDLIVTPEGVHASRARPLFSSVEVPT